MGKLNAIKAKALKEPGRHSDGKGLMLYIKGNGSKSWVLRVTVNGKRQDFGLGSFEDVTLADARDAADEIRKVVRQGGDPKQLKREAKVAKATALTFQQAAEAVHAEHQHGWRNKKHREQWLSTLTTYAFPSIGETLIGEVDGPAIRDLLAEIWLAKPETARRVRQRIGTVLDWAYAKGLRSAEAPMRSISKGLPRQPKKDNHFSALPYPEVPALMAKLLTTATTGRLALRFLILTATRSGEVRFASWKEVDLDAAVWTIPGERMKAGKEHIVPLTEDAIAILEEVKTAYGSAPDARLFPGKGGKPLSDMTLIKVLRTAMSGPHTVHGLRSAFRDWVAEQTDVPGEVVEVALSHTIPNKVEAAYRRTNFLEKRRALMKEWGGFVTSGIASQETPPKPTDKTA